MERPHTKLGDVLLHLVGRRCRRNPRQKLPRSLFGKGPHQNVFRRDVQIVNQVADPIDKGLGLARSRPRNHEQRRLRGLDDAHLFRIGFHDWPPCKTLRENLASLTCETFAKQKRREVVASFTASRGSPKPTYQ